MKSAILVRFRLALLWKIRLPRVPASRKAKVVSISTHKAIKYPTGTATMVGHRATVATILGRVQEISHALDTKTSESAKAVALAKTGKIEAKLRFIPRKKGFNMESTEILRAVEWINCIQIQKEQKSKKVSVKLIARIVAKILTGMVEMEKKDTVEVEKAPTNGVALQFQN